MLAFTNNERQKERESCAHVPVVRIVHSDSPFVSINIKILYLIRLQTTYFKMLLVSLIIALLPNMKLTSLIRMHLNKPKYQATILMHFSIHGKVINNGLTFTRNKDFPLAYIKCLSS